jgi:hypothetical protein
MCDRVAVPRAARIRDFADALRTSATSARRHSGIAHPFRVLADRRDDGRHIDR